MISIYSDLNKFGGETWEIKMYSLFHIFIYDTTDKSFLVELKEWRFFNYKIRAAYISKEDFEKTVINAFDKMQEYLNGTGEYHCADSEKNYKFSLIKDYVKGYNTTRKLKEEVSPKRADSYETKRLALEDFLKSAVTASAHPPSTKIVVDTEDFEIEDFELPPKKVISVNYRNKIRNEFSEIFEEFENSDKAHLLQETDDYVKYYWEFPESKTSNAKNTYAVRRIPNNKIRVEWTQDGVFGHLENSWEFNIDENQKKLKTSVNIDITKITRQALIDNLHNIQASFDKLDNIVDNLFDDSFKPKT